MNRVIYPQRMTYSKYDSAHVLGYLNEEVIEDYIPENAEEGTEAITAYAYSGEMTDGGTLIDAAATDRDTLINGLIRTRYTQSEEDAIKTHALIRLTEPDSEKAEEYGKEWEEFLELRTQAIQTVDHWLDL